MKRSIGVVNFFSCVCVLVCLFSVTPAFAFDDPPTRVARLSFVQGDVSFQPSGERDWAWASINRPMTVGDSLWTGDRSRAEMHIGSTAIRVGGETSVAFLNLDDRTVQIQLSSGTIDVRVRNLYRDDVFEVDTPNLAFTLFRKGDYRITVDPDGNFTTITLRDGEGQITGGGQAFLADGGSQVQVSGTDYISYDVYDLPGRDEFDRWCFSREQRENRSQSIRYVSPELTGYEDLDQNGTWRTDVRYGPVWIPTRVSPDWAPYREGHWAWVDPWGWTWVADESFGFVTSHYGRWTFIDSGYGRRTWAWVPPHHELNQQEVYEQRPVYSPALVTFVGDSGSSRDSARGGRVAWFALAPGEVYVPAYQASPTYVTNVNIRNTVVQQTTITNVVTNKIQTNIYVNQRVAGAVTAVPQATFVNAQPVAQAAVKLPPGAITEARVVPSAQVAPVRASVMGANKPTPPTATSPNATPPNNPSPNNPSQNAPAMTAPPKPPPTVVTRAVVAKVAPPPPPVAFERKQVALQANPGKPLDVKTEQNLRANAPAPVERIVKTAPPAQVVKPAEPEAKKPQPPTSPNTAQQVHPFAPGAPSPVPTTPQTPQQQQAAQQQGAAEKAKQQAAQQQIDADKAKQEAAQQQSAADKAKQQASQQQAAQQQAAADKAKQRAAQQQAAADKSKQEAAQQQIDAEKAKQQAAQQQAAQQQAASEKAKQEAAQQQIEADKAKQEAAQQQAAADKAKQQASQQQAAQQQAAADKAKQLAAQQQAAADKAKQEAAQQQAAQQQAAERAKQQAAQQQAAQQQAAAEKAKQDAAQQAAQQQAAERAKQQAAQQQAAQQQAAAEKAKQDAAQQAAQQQAAERAKQQAAQQQVAQQQAAERAKAEEAQQQAARRQADDIAKQKAAQQQAAQQQAAERAKQQAAQQQAATNSGPVRMPEGQTAGKLISQPKLNYPVDAKGARIQGTVRLQITIGADGRVKNASVLSGPQPLQAAALDNARQRQYQPTLVGGRPVEVETEVTIVF